MKIQILAISTWLLVFSCNGVQKLYWIFVAWVIAAFVLLESNINLMTKRKRKPSFLEGPCKGNHRLWISRRWSAVQLVSRKWMSTQVK